MPTAEALRALLDAAYQDLAGGEPAEAERRARALSALIRAEQDVAAFVAAASVEPTESDAEDIRAELRRRFRRLVEAEHAGAPDEVLERIAAETSSG